MASTISRINFEIKSELTAIVRRSVPVADPTLIEPDNAAVLIDGEWMAISTDGKLVRAVDLTDAAGTPTTYFRTYPLFTERGRSDIQAQSAKKMPIIKGGYFEADTRVYDATLNSGITAIGQALKVAVVTIGTRNYAGLIRHSGKSDSDPVVGYVEKLPASNGEKLRFSSGSRTFGQT